MTPNVLRDKVAARSFNGVPYVRAVKRSLNSLSRYVPDREASLSGMLCEVRRISTLDYVIIMNEFTHEQGEVKYANNKIDFEPQKPYAGDRRHMSRPR